MTRIKRAASVDEDYSWEGTLEWALEHMREYERKRHARAMKNKAVAQEEACTIEGLKKYHPIDEARSALSQLAERLRHEHH
jgi:hypothetical protein